MVRVWGSSSCGGAPVLPSSAAFEEAGESGDTPQVHYLLWKVTGDRQHIEAAKRLLDERVRHAPEQYRESMVNNVRLHREITSA